MADLSKPTATAASKQAAPKKGGNLFASLAPLACIVTGYVIWRFFLGNASNFTNPDPSGGFWPAHKGPIGSITKMYEGGIVVPILIGCLLIVLTFVIERLMTIKKSFWKWEHY
jgi:biopolymer transport protein ExbB